MITAIIVDDRGSQAAIDAAVLLTQSQELIGQTLIASANPALIAPPRARIISGNSAVDAFSKATTEAASKRIIVIGSSITLAAPTLSTFLSGINNSNLREHSFAPVASADGEIHSLSLSPTSLTATLSKQDVWPLLLLATSRSALLLVAQNNAESVTELLAQALIRAMADGDTIIQAPSIQIHTDGTSARSLLSLSSDARARCLNTALDALNIEELFAEHNWESYSNEAAAASYHSLAALFLTFGDTASAIQCLNCSEMLEESPRYFALKALIQQAKGETLGAVANLVSSLQCYESRKINDGKHYLSFKPENLEVINSSLVEGLNALNKRENEDALNHFSQAVFNFDPFYAEHGVSGIAKSR
jgi:hypothetical protein